MSTQRINAAEKDLEKFIKFLALKSTQVVVQSRLGEKIQTKCNPLAGNDWFNIVVEDHPDVHAETKKALALSPGENILKRLPLCVEISLKTAEGDQMILEVWSLDLQPNVGGGVGSGVQTKNKDTAANNAANDKAGLNQNINNTSQPDTPCLKTAHAIYNRMGMLLKSLISLTRATPAYKLSRRQCPDSYSIYYRIYVEKPQVHALGEGHKTVRIGNLNTIVGNLVMSVSYRTKMTITPSATAAQARTRESNTIMIDSNHFKHCENNSKQNAGNASNKKGSAGGLGGDKKIIDIEKPLRPGAFTDVGKLRQYTEDDFVLPETPPFEWLLRKPRHESTGSTGTGYGGSIESLNRKCDSPQTSPLGNGHQHNINNNAATINNNNNSSATNNNVTAFKSLENDENLQQPTAAAIPPSQKSPNNSTHSQSPVKSLFIPATINSNLPPNCRQQQASSPPSSITTTTLAHHLSSEDENLLKELNFPFASPTSHVNDLAKFYRDCYHAPPLKGLSEIQAETCSQAANNQQQTISSAANSCSNSKGEYSFVDDLSKQLEQFETSLEDYDKLVSQFNNLQTSSSTGSRSSGGLQMSN
ncbi:autophagy-related protein 13 homolog [Musca vetustissima]|uniref:autophagy-related protein 13 homolog n=1 Tax=Musca vetustissima TaxID=27455 RepID=UPI002AB6DD37|nr:autophagy-related protein 13 homolog [Musca vetustissima]